MATLLIVYLIYLVLFGLISHAVLFHLARFRTEGDVSGIVIAAYSILSVVIILGSILFLRPL